MRRHLSVTDEAEDLVQDAVERGLRSGRRPELLEELRPWMFRVIRNLHYDELRKSACAVNIRRRRNVYLMKQADRTPRGVH
jgi:DNA-directed RNA polymerase specialized sigma24 family protein